jgi:regulator of protease activity HflC (stomatin/prohibitin superfamily)
MAGVALVVLIVIAVILLIFLLTSFRVVQAYEKGIVFRLGRIQSRVREPGLTLIAPFVDRMQKVNMQIIAMGVPAQEGITRDNVSVRVDAVVYFRVIDPIKAVVNVQNYYFAVSQVAQTSLRSVIGKADLDQLLAEREMINSQLREIIDEPTEGPWGVRIERVEIKDVSLPEGMKRSMSRQAEAERERRARIISADGEYQASKRLRSAANVMSSDPAALQLRLLQTVVEVSAEKNSTLIMPMPVELLRFFDRMTPKDAPGSAKDSGARPETEPDESEEDLEEEVADMPDVKVDEPPALEKKRTEPVDELASRLRQSVASDPADLPAEQVRPPEAPPAPPAPPAGSGWPSQPQGGQSGPQPPQGGWGPPAP